ncbi:MAG: transmembrane sensor [Flavobacteriales bacterium]|jgi:ferric-dicitrate binding protein FerR (iron transport regulator)
MEESMKEILVNKWFEGTLSGEELAAFKALPEYPDYLKISEAATQFGAPHFDSDTVYEGIQAQKAIKKHRNFGQWWKIAAAVLLLATCSYFFTQENRLETYTTEIAEQKTIILPDNSEIILNAQSTIRYSQKDWDDNRLVYLDGEAFFKVAKGETFDVQTTHGTVTVLGTQFNVKERLNYFAVQTYEGLVGVKHPSYTGKLPAGTGVQIANNNTTPYSAHSIATVPSWTEKSSTFESTPYHMVLEEVERQFAVRITSNNNETTKLFTGSFTHTDLKQALKTITLPMHLTFTIDGSNISLTNN